MPSSPLATDRAPSPMVRFFLQVAPGEMGDVGHGYLRALAQLATPVRAIPIGPATAMNTERRWYELARAFMEPMRVKIAGDVNVVCAPLGTMMGTRTPMHAMMGRGSIEDASDRRHATREAAEIECAKVPDVVYEPATAFSGLWTAGYRNVAIITDDFTELDEDPSAVELRFLADYDLVIVGSETSNAQRLRDLLARATREIGAAAATIEIPVVPVIAVGHLLLEDDQVRAFGRLITNHHLELRAPPAPSSDVAPVAPMRSREPWWLRITRWLRRATM